MFGLPLLDAITLSAFEDPQRSDTFVLIYDQRGLPDGPLRFKQILSRIRRKIQHYPRFHRLLKSARIPFNEPRWVSDERFDVEFHVRHLALPKPGDWRQFCIQVARLHSRPLDSSRPLWEINAVEGLDNIPWLGEGHFALVCKVHHGLLDPSQVQDLIWSLHDEVDAAPNVPPRNNTLSALPLGNLLGRTIDNALSPLEGSLRQASTLFRESRAKVSPVINFYGRALLGGISVPYTRFNTDISSFRVWQSCSFPLDKVRRVQALFPDATQEDLLLALISGAMRGYLEEKTEFTARELSAIAPTHTAGMLEEESTLSLDTFSLATQCEDPAERVQMIMKQRKAGEAVHSRRSGWSARAPLPDSPMQRMALATHLLQRVQQQQSGVPVASTALVNVAGTDQPLSLMGAPLVYFSGVAEIADGLGLVHLATRHNQRLNISVTSCREMLPDPGFYRECIERSFVELLNASVGVDGQGDVDGQDHVNGQKGISGEVIHG